MRPLIFEFTRAAVQKALDALSATLTDVEGRGTRALYKPELFAFPLKEEVGSPEAGCMAIDRATGKIVRHNGSTWVDLT